MLQLFLHTISFLLVGALAATAQEQDYGRDENEAVCVAIRSAFNEKSAQMNEPRRNATLYEAADKGCVSLARDLLHQGASLLARDRLGNTALHHAAGGGHTGMVRLFLDQGADPDRPNIEGTTPLLSAVLHDRSKAVALLLKEKARIDVIGGGGITPLAAAAFNGNDRILKMLLDQGAVPDQPDGTGKGATVYAAVRGYESSLRLLIGAGADPDKVFAHGLTALMWAAGHGNDVPEAEGLAAAKTLIESGASIAAQDDRGRTALMIAAERGHALIVSYLLERGAMRETRDAKGLSASDLAANDAVRVALRQ